MTSATPAANTTWSLPFSHQEWDHTPCAVRDHVVALANRLHALPQQVDMLQGRLDKTSNTSSKPPSSDSPFQKPTRRTASGTRGARKGHPGAGVTLRAPTDVHHVSPAPCACGHGALATPTPYQTHQVLELPPIAMDIRHFLLHQARCVGCGALRKADVPSDHTTGYGPRLTALIGELGGMHRTSRRLVHDFCHPVLHLPLSLGAIHKVIDRAAQALVPHYEAIATLARHAPVGDIDETPWYCQHTLQWLWTMATDTVSLYLIHPHRFQRSIFDLDRGLAGHLGQRWVRRLSRLGEPSPHVSGASHPYGARVVGKTRPAPCGLWGLGAQGVAALVRDGHGASHGRGVARVVCAGLPLDRSLPCAQR
jgi:transposase